MALRVWIRLGRVSNLPTVWSNVLCAVALAGTLPAWAWVVALCAVFSLFYVAGMYLNDAFDRHIDAEERPDRPIPSGQVSAGLVFGLGFGGLALAVALTALVAGVLPGASSYRALASGSALAAFIVGYNLHHKQNPLSPLVMGMCRVLVYVTAALAVGGAASFALAGAALALLCYLIGLTYAAKQETLQRIENVWPLMFLALAPAYGLALSLERPLTLGFVALLIAWVVYSVSFLWSARRRSVPSAVVRLIAGIALLDATLIAATGNLWLAGVAVAFCSLTRVFQRVVPGT